MRNLHVKRVLNTMLLLQMLLQAVNAQLFDFDPPKIANGATLKFVEGPKPSLRTYDYTVTKYFSGDILIQDDVSVDACVSKGVNIN